MARPKKDDIGTPVNLRVSEALHTQLKHAAVMLDKSITEVMRDAMRIGLEDLKRCNYDVAGAVVDRAHSEKEIAMLAEPRVIRYGKQKRA